VPPFEVKAVAERFDWWGERWRDEKGEPVGWELDLQCARCRGWRVQ
jgi:hypothetical protein